MIATAVKPDHPAPLLVSAAEAARMLGVSEATLRRLTAPAGSLPVVRVRGGTATTGGRMRHVARYRPEDLRAWIARELVQPVTETSSPPRT